MNILKLNVTENLESSWKTFKIETQQNVKENSIQMKETEKAFKAGVIEGIIVTNFIIENYPEPIAINGLRSFIDDYKVFTGKEQQALQNLPHAASSNP